MDTKLTLKLDKAIIEKAKRYASQQNRSLSGIIESYLNALTQKEVNEEFQEVELTSFIKGLVLKSDLPADYDYKSELGNMYAEKYK